MVLPLTTGIHITSMGDVIFSLLEIYVTKQVLQTHKHAHTQTHKPTPTHIHNIMNA